jgi:hypothetical protein
MTFHSIKPVAAEALAAAVASVYDFAEHDRLRTSNIAALDQTVRVPNSRGRVLLAIAELRGIEVDRVEPSDPLIRELSSYEAWAVDIIRLRYNAKRYGPPSPLTIYQSLLDLENEGVIGPNTDDLW